CHDPLRSGIDDPREESRFKAGNPGDRAETAGKRRLENLARIVERHRTMLEIDIEGMKPCCPRERHDARASRRPDAKDIARLSGLKPRLERIEVHPVSSRSPVSMPPAAESRGRLR